MCMFTVYYILNVVKKNLSLAHRFQKNMYKESAFNYAITIRLCIKRENTFVTYIKLPINCAKGVVCY